jgi:hypothetical protein
MYVNTTMYLPVYTIYSITNTSRIASTRVLSTGATPVSVSTCAGAYNPSTYGYADTVCMICSIPMRLGEQAVANL